MVFFLFMVKTRHIAVACLVTDLRYRGFVALECIGFLSPTVHGDDLMCPRGREGRQIAGMLRVGRVSHRTCQGIGREEILGGILGLQFDMPCR